MSCYLFSDVEIIWFFEALFLLSTHRHVKYTLHAQTFHKKRRNGTFLVSQVSSASYRLCSSMFEISYSLLNFLIDKELAARWFLLLRGSHFCCWAVSMLWEWTFRIRECRLVWKVWPHTVEMFRDGGLSIQQFITIMMSFDRPPLVTDGFASLVTIFESLVQSLLSKWLTFIVDVVNDVVTSLPVLHVIFDQNRWHHRSPMSCKS